MGFKTINTSEKSYIAVKQHVLNTEGFVSKYTILDSMTKTPYYFNCVQCKKSSTNIESENAQYFDAKRLKIESASLLEFGGTGLISKLIACENCGTTYFVGIGYIEPNNGRDVFLLHNILELKEID